MIFLVKWLLLFLLTMVHSQSDPRKRFILDSSEFTNKDEDISCSIRTCYKRSNQDELGPFWANRGKREPTFLQERLYVDEPHWVLVRRDQNADGRGGGGGGGGDVPFFTSRGKKEGAGAGAAAGAGGPMRRWVTRRRNRRHFAGDDSDPAFFAARGKKLSLGNP